MITDEKGIAMIGGGKQKYLKQNFVPSKYHKNCPESWLID
jgi:hypothetical protein